MKGKTKSQKIMKYGSERMLLFGNLPKLAVSHAGITDSLCYMAMNCSNPFKVKDLGRVAGLSRRGFQKAFRKHVGLSPGKALRRLRIEHAKLLLMQSDLSLKEIAVKSGYRSANTFCIAFRQVAGVAPKKFQRQAWLATYLHYQRNKPWTLTPPFAANSQ